MPGIEDTFCHNYFALIKYNNIQRQVAGANINTGHERYKKNARVGVSFQNFMFIDLKFIMHLGQRVKIFSIALGVFTMQTHSFTFYKTLNAIFTLI